MARLAYDKGKQWARFQSIVVPNPLNGGATDLKIIMSASSLNPGVVNIESVKEGGNGTWVDADYLKNDPGIQALTADSNIDRETRRFLKREKGK